MYACALWRVHSLGAARAAADLAPSLSAPRISRLAKEGERGRNRGNKLACCRLPFTNGPERAGEKIYAPLQLQARARPAP